MDRRPIALSPRCSACLRCEPDVDGTPAGARNRTRCGAPSRNAAARRSRRSRSSCQSCPRAVQLAEVEVVLHLEGPDVAVEVVRAVAEVEVVEVVEEMLAQVVVNGAEAHTVLLTGLLYLD